MLRLGLVVLVALGVLATGCSKPDESRKAAPGASVAITAEATGTERQEGAPRLPSKLPIHHLTPIRARELPAGTVLIVAESCAVCWSEQLLRVERNQDGTWRSEALMNVLPTDSTSGVPLVPIISDGANRFAAVWCIADGGCGKRHDGSVVTEIRLLLTSDDGGVSWSTLAEVPPTSHVVGFKDGRVLLVVLGSPQNTFVLYPGGTAISLPSDHPIESTPSLAGWQITQVGDSVPYSIANDASSFISVTRAGVAPSEYFAFPGGRLRISGALSPTLLLGTAERSSKAMLLGSPTTLGGFDRLPVIVDLEAKTIAPIDGLVPSAEYSNMRPLLLLVGPFARVVTGGDCLHVREHPGAASVSLGCFKDGVLLRLRAETEQTRDGITWLAVETADRRAGWASAGFLER